MPVGRRVLSTDSGAIRMREWSRSNRKKGLCRCGKPGCLESPARCIECRERDRTTYRDIRKKVIDHYGGKCLCCGISELKFLALDHTEGNGNQHRLEVTGTKRGNIYRWILKNNFPPSFQILCHNCNMAKGCYGVCPHQENKKEG